MEKKCIEIEVDLSKLFGIYESLSPLDRADNFETDEGSVINLNSRGKQVLEEINMLLNKLYLLSHKEEHYWSDCPFETYKATFNHRLKSLQSNQDPDMNEIDLLFQDFKIFHHFPGNRVLRSYSYNHLLDDSTKEKFNNANEKKVHYIKERLKAKGLIAEISIGKFSLQDINQFAPYYKEPIEFGKIFAIDKVATLMETGLFNLMRERLDLNTPTSMANFLQLITGEKQSTLQSMCNPVYNTFAKDKNHPLKSDKALDRVHERLRKLGISPSK